MSKIYILILSLAGSITCVAQARHHVQVVSSQFFIEGKTNVNEYECSLFQRLSKEKLSVKSTWKNYRLSFEGLQFQYKVEDFDCGLKPMNEDMQSLLNSHAYPYLYLEIHRIHISPDNDQIEQLHVAADVSITLAGITRQYHIEKGRVLNHTENDLTFEGKKKLKLTDFNIQPPTKFFGLVEVTNELAVDFEIHMHVEPL